MIVVTHQQEHHIPKQAPPSIEEKSLTSKAGRQTEEAANQNISKCHGNASMAPPICSKISTQDKQEGHNQKSQKKPRKSAACHHQKHDVQRVCAKASAGQALGSSLEVPQTSYQIIEEPTARCLPIATAHAHQQPGGICAAVVVCSELAHPHVAARHVEETLLLVL